MDICLANDIGPDSHIWLLDEDVLDDALLQLLSNTSQVAMMIATNGSSRSKCHVATLVVGKPPKQIARPCYRLMHRNRQISAIGT